ncbi:caspase domain-containing protein [Russula compacta]|nr:caspase domain-containing protein [Russula compacta]
MDWRNNPRPPAGPPVGPPPWGNTYGQPRFPPHVTPGPPPGPPLGPPPIPSGTYPGSGPPRHGMAPPMGLPGPPPGPPPRPPGGQQRYGPQLQGQQQQQTYFQYSQCTGRKKALCIGINYFRQQAELRGCINDARNMERFLCEKFGYKRDDIVVLTDDQQDPRSKPTRDNMLMAMQWLVMDARPNDSLFFHYSGHGGQTKDLDGDEDDGFDEVIYPVDFKKAGHIVDDQMHDIMVKSLPPGCRLTAIFDASCAPTFQNFLSSQYSTEGKVKEPNLVMEAGQGLLGAVSSYARGDLGGVFQSVTGAVRSATTGRAAEQRARQTKTSPADVISWSGCKDSQTSADAVEAGAATGAMSYPQQSYQQLLLSLRNILRAKYSQKPQVSKESPFSFRSFCSHLDLFSFPVPILWYVQLHCQTTLFTPS